MSSKADGKGGPRPPSPPGPIFPPHLLPRGPSNPAQTMVDLFWARFTARNPGKATTLLPKNELAQRLSKRTAAKDLAGGDTKTTSTSYEEAAAACREKVAQIVRECRRVNQKYRDPHFDLDYDLKNVGHPNCLRSLGSSWADYSSGPDSGTEGSPAPRRKGRPKKIQEGERSRSAYLLRGERPKRSGKETKRRNGEYYESDADDDEDDGYAPNRVGGDVLGQYGRFPGWRLNPRSVKRVSDIFDDPKFYIEGPTANDIRQGADGDCWFMAAICALTNKPGLIERVCVARDEKVGVYGFVFHRDGEWISEIIDDKLYLKKPDYEEKNSAGSQRNFDRLLWDEMDHRQDPDEHYRKTFQRNSTALYFAQCEHKNETWLPLLEKAYAKAHGDYAAIDGGFTGEGIEDLTGGVTSELFTADILDPELFWKDGLMKVNDEYLFGCSTGDWRGFGERKGIQELHAYSVLEAREVDGHRLVLLKNPWGRGEWQGAWSDGSKEWTPERMQKLNHRFGDDGAFWISYKDLLRKYQHFDRTRLFDDKWKVTSMWTTLNVSWAPDYHDTKFAFTLEKSGPVVIVLSQLDDRYFRGFEGPYSFGIGFRLHKAGEKEYLVRAQTTYRMTRSCNVELHLEAGEYTVLVRIDAKRTDGKMHPEEVIRQNTKERREKLLRIAMSYDLAHSKAKIVKMPEEKEAREKHEKKQNERYRQKILKREKNELQRQYQQECRRFKIEAKKRAHEFAWTKRHHEKLEAKWRAAEEARQKEWEREQAEMRPAGRNGRGDGKCKLPIEKGQPEAEAKVENGNSVPSSSTDLGENTPSASTNDTLKTDVVENDAEKTDNAGIETQEDLPADELAGKTSEGDDSEQKMLDEVLEKVKGIEAKVTAAGFGKQIQPNVSVRELPVEEVSEGDPEEEMLEEIKEKLDDIETRTKATVEIMKKLDDIETRLEKVGMIGENEVGSKKWADEVIKRLGIIEAETKSMIEQANEMLKSPALASPHQQPTTVSRDEAIYISQQLHQGVARALAAINDIRTELDTLGQSIRGHLPNNHEPHLHHQLADEPPSVFRGQPQSRDHSPPHVRHAQQRQDPPPPPAPASTYYSYNDDAPERGPSRHRHHHRRYPHYHNNHHHRRGPPPPPPPPPQGFEDSEPESMMPPCSPLEVSEAELDSMVEENEREAHRIIHTDRGPFVRPPPGAPGPGPGGPIFVHRGRSPPPPHPRGMHFGDTEEPWNAVAVVGLRIYYKIDDEDGEGKEGVKLKVVRPILYYDSESDDECKDHHEKGECDEWEVKKEVEENKVLDIDDSAKDAIEEVEGRAKE